MPTPDREALKKLAAIHAVRFVEPGMTVGLGTGSTAIHAVREIARRHAAGELPGIRTFATSSAVGREAAERGLPMLDEKSPPEIDVTIDGADEVDPELNLIKGGGGALLHEKIVAQASRREIIVVDEAKLSPRLGTLHPLPVEILCFGEDSQRRFLEDHGLKPVLRITAAGQPFVTDEGNVIHDCHCGPIADAAALATLLASRAGIAEHGLFLGMTNDLIIAGADGLRHLQRDPATGAITTVAV